MNWAWLSSLRNWLSQDGEGPIGYLYRAFSAFGDSAARQDAIVSGGLNVGRYLAKILLIVMVGSAVRPEVYGAFALFQIVVLIGVRVVGLELYSHSVRTLPGAPPKKVQVHWVGLTLYDFGVCGGLAALGFTLWVLTDGQLPGAILPGRAGWGWIMLAILLALASRNTGRLLFAREQVSKAALIEFTRNTGWVVLLGGFWLAHVDLNTEWIWYATYCAAMGLALVVGWRVLSVKFGSSNEGHATHLVQAGLDHIREAAPFSSVLFIATLGYELFVLTDRLLLEHFHGSAEVGVYSYNLGIIAVSRAFVMAVVMNVLAPRFHRALNEGQGADALSLMKRMFTYGIGGVVVLCMGVLVLYDPFLGLFADPGYLLGFSVLATLAMGIVTELVTVPYHHFLLNRGRAWTLSLTSLTGAAVNVGTGVVTIPEYPYIGAAVATAAGYLVIGLLRFLLVRKLMSSLKAAAAMSERIDGPL